MIVVLVTAYLLGMAAAIPMGPVGALLLKVPQKKWFQCLFALWVLDVIISAVALFATDPFLRISSSPQAKLFSSVFLVGFALRGLITQKRPSTAVSAKSSSLYKVLVVAMANPGTYLMIASAFLFLNLSALDGFCEKWLALACLSLGAVSWYHFVRFVFRKKSAMFQYRFERAIFVLIGIIGMFTLFASVANRPHF